MQGIGNREQETEQSPAVPVRGTQSFVGVMAEVFKRPSLTGLEVLWRWVFWVAVLAWPVRRSYSSLIASAASVQAGGFSPWEAWVGYPLSMRIDNIPMAVTTLIVLVLLWAVASAAGRRLVMLRADSTLRPSFITLFVLGVLRWFWWAAALGVWLSILRLALNGLVLRALMRGGDPQWVGFCAVEIAVTLLCFVAWLATSWVFSSAVIYSAQNGWGAIRSLRAACRRSSLAGRLAEINLVMGIVKIALLVLAMVLSACPLPFQSVETQQFLVLWTAGVLLLYFVASDYFHVVRLVAFLRMTEVISQLPAGPAARQGEGAS